MVKLFKNIFSIFFILAINAQQTSTISGFVRDNATGEPLSYVNVFVVIGDSYKGSATNQDGYYVISNLFPGKYNVNASIIGYKMTTNKVTLASDEKLRLDFRLNVSALEGQEVNVSAERIKFQQSIESSQISLDLREINTVPGFIEADVFRTLQMLPGVQSGGDFSSALYVRGSTPDQNLIMLDGITIYNPYHLGGIFSTFNTDAIKEADFHAGGFPARYGGRMGAILNVINREGNTEKITGSGNISLVTGKALIEGPLPKWKGIKGSWLLSGRRTYFDQFINLVTGTKGQFPYFFYDYQFKTNIDINQNHRLTYTRFYGDDILRFSSSDQSSNNIGGTSKNTYGVDWPWGNHTNGLTWRWIVSPSVVAKTFLSSSRYRYDFDFYFDTKETYIDNDSTFQNNLAFDVVYKDIIKDRTLETEIIWKANDKHTVTSGFQIKNINFELVNKFIITTLDTTFTEKPLDMRNKTRELAAYIQDKWSVTNNLKLQGGLRLAHYNLHDTLYVEPRIGMKYNFSSDMSFKINWGRYHQFLITANDPDENFRLIDLWLGVPEDKPASVSDHTILGFEYFSPDDILFRVETYYKGFDNLLSLKQEDVYTENEDDVQTTTMNEFWDTDAYAYGLELLAKKTSGKIKGWIGYTYAKTFNYTPPNGWYAPNHDRTHTLNIVSTIELPKWASDNLEMSASLTASSGNPYTPIKGRSYDWNQELNGARDEDQAINLEWKLSNKYLVDEKNSDRYPPYFRFDLGLTRKNRRLFKWKYDSYFQIINITNHKNALSYTYRTNTDQSVGNRGVVERAAINTFPFMIFTGVQFEF
ncbi:MAG: TonB-dependent receptor [Candidatus Marinimicrobia bacterium]|nr:TonB-dependent receptor [Candidatus Neomarinimicrobiota bacterium]